jgi:hypothetical protein
MTNGLARKSDAPAASSWVTIACPESPLSTTTGIAAVAGEAASSARTCRPLLSGRRLSSRMRLGGAPTAASTPSRPVRATRSHTSSRRRRMRSTSTRLSSLSSMYSTE